MEYAAPFNGLRRLGLSARILSIAAVGFLVLATAPAQALEIDAEGTLGNLGFTADREADDTDLGAGTVPWDARLSVSGTVLDGFLLTGTYERDSVLGNTVSATLGYTGQIMSVAAGPFVGFILDTENPSLLKPGVSAALRAELWETGFLSFETDVTLDPQISDSGTDFAQFRINPRGGVYVPNIILAAEMDRSTLFLTDSGDQTTTRKTIYALDTEIFQKAIPYRILLRFAYRTQLKEFADGSKHALGAAVFTPGVTYAPTDALTLRTRLENGIYVFGREDLLGEIESDRYFFRATFGINFEV